MADMSKQIWKHKNNKKVYTHPCFPFSRRVAKTVCVVCLEEVFRINHMLRNFPIEQHGIKCPACADEIYSNSRHDFVSCKCGDIFIDGGFDYVRIGFKDIKPERISRMLIEAPPFKFRQK